MPLPSAHWRLLLSPFADGPTNMAVDEAILQGVAEAGTPPTLRLFGWVPPCLSLGYAQPAGDVDVERLRALGYGLVRRPTGGRAILHTDELTYSVVAPMDEPRVRGGVVESYRQLSGALLRGLEFLGLRARADGGAMDDGRRKMGDGRMASADNAVCFEVPSNYEITVGKGEGQRKLLGSAQVRKRGVVLQHGTLPLAGDIARICDVLSFASEEARQRARGRVYQRAATVGGVLGQGIAWDQAAAALARGFALELNLVLEERPLSEKEWELAGRLRQEKYAADEWNYRV